MTETMGSRRNPLVTIVGEKVVSIFLSNRIMVLFNIILFEIFDELFIRIPKKIRMTVGIFFLIIGFPLLLYGSLISSIWLEIGALLLTMFGFILLWEWDSISEDEETHIVQKIGCPQCKQVLNIPSNYTGLVSCPTCKEEIHLNNGLIGTEDLSDVISNLSYNSKPNDEVKPYNDSSEENLTIPYGIKQNQLSLGVSAVGVIIGFLAIYLFFSAFTMDAWCPEEDQSEVIREGETVISCQSSEMWNGTINRLFFSCCLFVPLSTFFTSVGIKLRKSRNNVVLSTEIEHDSQTMVKDDSFSENFSESPLAVSLQSTAKWFGIGLMLFVAIMAVLLVALLIIVLNAILSSDGLFA